MTFLWVTLGIVAVLLAIVQIFGIVFSIFAKPQDCGIKLKKDDNSMFSVQVTENVYEWLIISVGMVILVLRKKGFIRYMAEQDAEKKDYNNRFKKNSFKEAYDKSFLAKRKAIIEETVVEDVANNRKTTLFWNDSEKAIYQNSYLQKLTGKENIENLLDQRVKELYAEIELEPVEDHVFNQIAAKANY